SRPWAAASTFAPSLGAGPSFKCACRDNAAATECTMLDRAHILIADDDVTLVESTADLLRREGYLCTCVTSAMAAAAALATEQFDLLIADIKMPGNSELEFIRALPELDRELPVILITGYPTLRSAIDSVHLRIAAYLVKPVELDDLLRSVDE